MKKTLTILAAVAAILVARGQEAAPAVETEEAEATWTISAGVSYRDFHGVQLKRRANSSFQDFVVFDNDGSVNEPTDGNLKEALIQRYGALPTQSSPFYSLDYASYSGSGSRKTKRLDSDSFFGPAISAETGFYDEDSVKLNLVLGLEYFRLNGKATGGVNGGMEVYSLHGVWNSNTSTYSPAWGGEHQPASGNTAIATAGSGKMKFSADLYVLDLGIKGAIDVIDNLALFAAAGPTLTLADMESSANGGLSSNGTTLSGVHQSDDKWQARLGYYLAGGAKYDFNANWGLSAELRWDDTFGKIGTKIAKQRLDGFGGVLKVSYTF